MGEILLALLYCFGIEYACHEAEEQAKQDLLHQEYSHCHTNDPKPQEVLAILEKLKIGGQK